MAIVFAETSGTGAHQPRKLTFRIAHAFRPFDERFCVAPFEWVAVTFFFCDIAALIKFHRCGDRTRCGDGVETIFIAEHVADVDGVKIVVAAVAAVCPQRFIFRTADNLVANFDNAGAGDWTAVAGAGFDKIRISQCFCRRMSSPLSA